MIFFTEIVWKPYEVYRGQQIFGTTVQLYAVRIGFDVKVSTELSEIHKYVDEYWKNKAS